MGQTKSRPSVVIVGAGLMGQWHHDAAERSGARVVGVVDRDMTRAAALARNAPIWDSLAPALQQRVDVVHICTPPATHAALCREALAAGSHVIVEKPATPDADTARELAAAAQTASRMVVPVHQFVFQYGVQRIHRHLPRFGAIRHLEFATASAGAAMSGAEPDAVAAEIAPHPLALVRFLLGVDVGELAWRLSRPMRGEWRVSAVAPTGTSISAMISMGTRPTFASCRILGEQGSATADLFHGFAVFERGRFSRPYKMIRPVAVGLGMIAAASSNLLGRAARSEVAYPGLRALCRATYMAIDGRGPPPFRVSELIDVARARDQWVRLAAADETA